MSKAWFMQVVPAIPDCFKNARVVSIADNKLLVVPSHVADLRLLNRLSIGNNSECSLFCFKGANVVVGRECCLRPVSTICFCSLSKRDSKQSTRQLSTMCQSRDTK